MQYKINPEATTHEFLALELKVQTWICKIKGHTAIHRCRFITIKSNQEIK